MYDLIFVDPPTFSNSKRAEDFDVQRDHARLLNFCGERLLPDGVILFSNNFRRFKLDEAGLSSFAVKEINGGHDTVRFRRGIHEFTACGNCVGSEAHIWFTKPAEPATTRKKISVGIQCKPSTMCLRPKGR